MKMLSMKILTIITVLGITFSACAQDKTSALKSTSTDTSLAVNAEGAQDVTVVNTEAEGFEKTVQPKKVSILGDSYSTFKGWVPEKNIAWYMPVPKEGRPTDVTEVDQTWWKIFIDKNGYQLEKNNSYSGSTICNTGYGRKDYTDQSFVTRLTDIGNPDLIFVFGGTNDSFADSPLGEYIWKDWTKKELFQYRPATAYMLSELKRLHPNAEIWFIIGDDMKPQYAESSRLICEHYNVPVLELKDIQKMSIHPDQKGMLQIVDQLEQALGLSPQAAKG